MQKYRADLHCIYYLYQTYADGMRIWKHFVGVGVVRTQFLMSLRTLSEKKNFFTATFLRSGNNNTTRFQLYLQFFAHATLVKAGPEVQSIFNLIAVAGSVNADAVADAWRFSCADVNPKFQDLHISDLYWPPTREMGWARTGLHAGRPTQGSTANTKPMQTQKNLKYHPHH